MAMVIWRKLIQIMVKLTTGFYQKLISELFNRVLEDFAREFQLGEDRHIILTIDTTGWHTSFELKIPLGLHLEYLPAYSLLFTTCRAFMASN